jgi:EAL domain-containing protein (putative c-di-GMP-specific phosphodiesterase class I)
MLRNLGCDHLQGFLFAKPLSYDETLLFLEEKIEKDNLSATG